RRCGHGGGRNRGNPADPGDGPRPGDLGLSGNHAHADLIGRRGVARTGLWEGMPMNGAEALDVARDGIFTLLKLSAPLMLVGLAVGLVIALFQALTQIQEVTLVFVPKILAIFVTLLLMLPFM